MSKRRATTRPTEEKAAAKKPAAEKSAAKKPAAKQPAAKKPAAKQPAAKKPAAKKPAATKAPTKKASVKKPAPSKPAARAVTSVDDRARALVAAVETTDFVGPTRGVLRPFPGLFAKVLGGKRGAVDALWELLDRPAAALAAPFLVDALRVPGVARRDVLSLLAHVAIATPERWIGKPLDPAAMWFGQRNTRCALAARLVADADGGPTAQVLLSDPDPGVAAATAALIAWLDPETVAPCLPALRALAGGAVPAPRALARLALGNLGAPLDEVSAGLDDPSPTVRICTAVAVARRCGADLPDRAVTALEDGLAAAVDPAFPWYGGAPAALARAQYLALDARFRPRVLARAAAMLDAADPWPTAEALLAIAFPERVRADWKDPLPELGDLPRTILGLILARPALLADRAFGRFAISRRLPQKELRLRAWARLPLVTPHGYPVRRALTFGDRTADVAVWIMEHADGAVADSEALVAAIAGALDDEELAEVALAWDIEVDATGGCARTRPIAVPVIPVGELPDAPGARAAHIEARQRAQLAALIADGWEIDEDDLRGGHSRVIAWRGFQRAELSYDARLAIASQVRWSVLRALGRLGATRPGLLRAAARLDREGQRATALGLWALADPDAAPLEELDEPAVRFQQARTYPMHPIPAYLQRLPAQRREAAVVRMLERAHENRRGQIALVQWCRTPATLALAVKAFESGLSWSGQGLDEREVVLLALAAGPAAIPLLEQLATQRSHPRIALAIERCRAAGERT